MKRIILLALGFMGASIAAYAQCKPNVSNIYTYTFNGNGYEIIKENLNWVDAAACAATRGGRLVELNSKAEQDTFFAKTKLAGIENSSTMAPDGGGASYIWIGGNDKAQEEKWIWDAYNCIREIENHQPDFICLNFANTDMVGHTGDFKAAIKAAETVDKCLQNLINKAINYNYKAIIIADHGNSDYMINEDGTPNTAHTMNPVPVILVGKDIEKYQLNSGKLADIAPTILYLMGIAKPEEMTGDVLCYS